MDNSDFSIIDKGINWNIYKNSTILITGATGRLGRYFLDALQIANNKNNLNIQIIALARSKEKSSEIFDNLLENKNITFLYQDINDKICFKQNVDYIFHTAGPAAPADFNNFCAETLWAHVNGTHNILEFARTHNCKRIFYVSTVEVYGEFLNDIKIKENDMGVLHINNYRSCYPEAKRLCETMLECYKKEYNIDYCGMRCSHTLGPGISLIDGRAFAEFIKSALNEKDIVLSSDGTAIRTYTYTPDAINAAFLIMEKGKSKFYNVCAENNIISIKDLAELIIKLSQAKATKICYSAKQSGKTYLNFKLNIMDTTEIKKLGWKPQTNLEQTFQKTIDSFKG